MPVAHAPPGHDANDPKWRAVEKSIPSRQSKSLDAEAVDLNAMQADCTQPSTSTENPLPNSDRFEPSPEVSVGMEEKVGEPNAGRGVIEATGDGDECDENIDDVTNNECMEEEAEATAMENALYCSGH